LIYPYFPSRYRRVFRSGCAPDQVAPALAVASSSDGEAQAKTGFLHHVLKRTLGFDCKKNNEACPLPKGRRPIEGTNY
jgi:hypothetical protein